MVFLPLAILNLVLGETGQGVGGATLFLISRLAYAPIYIAGVAHARTVVWGVGLIGLTWMAWVLV